MVAVEDALVAVEDALVAVEDAFAAVGGGTSAVEEGHTLDAVEDGTLAVEGVANLLVVRTRQQWSWSACPCCQTVWTCSHCTACPSCPFGPKVAFFYFNFFFCKLGIHWQLSL